MSPAPPQLFDNGYYPAYAGPRRRIPQKGKEATMTPGRFDGGSCAGEQGRRAAAPLVLVLLFAALAWANTVGKNSCVGQDACTGNTGAVGNGSCNGIEACFNSTGNVKNNSCNGD